MNTIKPSPLVGGDKEGVYFSNTNPTVRSERTPPLQGEEYTKPASKVGFILIKTCYNKHHITLSTFNFYL